MKLSDIKKFPEAAYEIDVSWRYIENILSEYSEGGGGSLGGLNMNPDYQREHVWSKKQQMKYIEYSLMGGEVGKNIIWNCPDWGSGYKSPLELVDGKQRIEAVRSFLRDDIPAFGCFYSKYEDKLNFGAPRFTFQICKLKTREEVLQLYLNINAGGTPHSKEEIERVKKLLENERHKNQ